MNLVFTFSRYNNKSIELTNEDYLTAELVKFNLENLESFQTYELSVVAGTVADSKPSNKVHVQTAVSGKCSHKLSLS